MVSDNFTYAQFAWRGILEPSKPLLNSSIWPEQKLAFVLSVITFGLLILNNSLGIFQGCITVYLSRCLLLLLIAATHLEYHVAASLSTTFLNFLEKFFGSRMFLRFLPALSSGQKLL